MNKVHKIIYRDNEITFVIQTEGESHFWWWSVTKDEARPYFEKIKGLFNLEAERITPAQADKFVNDYDNSTLGISSSPYESIDEILKEQGIL